jgi:multisubunit Na+/H+ antiporter MnhB subunit
LNPTAVYDGLFSRGDSSDTQPSRRSLLDWGFWLVDGFIQDGRLRYYIAFLSFGFVSIIWAAIGYVLVEGSLEFPNIGEELGNATILETFIAIIAMFAAIQTTRAKRRLAAVVWAGITGTQTAMLFVLFGAPDLAFTELLIEVLSLILMMLAFRLLPRYMQNKSRYEAARTIRDVVIAASVGLTMTVVTLLVSANRQLPSIRTWFEDNAYKLGRGENIVNVILVDFRGIDTLGEVTVLVIAALGVLSLISPMPLLDLLDRPEDETIEDDVHEGPYTEHRHDDEPIVSHIYGRVAVILRRQAIRSGTVKKTTKD